MKWAIYLVVIISVSSGSCFAQQITAQLPLATINTQLTTSQKALLASIPLGYNCGSPIAHVYCATTNFADLVTSNCAAAGPLIPALNDLATDGSSDIVIVIPAGSVAAHGICNAPFGTRASTCIGNNTLFQTGCDIRMPQTFQTATNYANHTPRKIFFVSSNHANIPAQGVRLIPVSVVANIDASSGDGYSLRLGQIANISPSNDLHTSPDLWGIRTGGVVPGVDNGPAIWLGNGASNYVFMDMEAFVGSKFVNPTNSAVGEIGDTLTIFGVQGLGASGARPISVSFGGTTLFRDNGIELDPLEAVITHCHTLTPTGADCATAGVIPATPTLLYFDGLNTNMVAGRSFIQFTWNNYDHPASDVVVNAIPGCAAGATAAGNGIVGNLCVSDTAHQCDGVTPGNCAYTSVTYTPTSPWNGGIHAFYIDTVPMTTASSAVPACAAPDGTYPVTPVVGGTWCGNTEHAFSMDAIPFWFDSTGTQQWTLTGCAADTGNPCLQSSLDGMWFVPNDAKTHTLTGQGATTGSAPRTNWSTAAGGMQFLIGAGGPASMAIAGTPTVTTGATFQTITGVTAKATGLQVVTDSLNVWPATFSTGPAITPSTEINPQFKTLSVLYTATAGIDQVGPYRRSFNWSVRGKQYTLDVYGLGVNWAAISCANGSTNVVNFGSDIEINSCTPISATHFTVTYTVCDGTMGPPTHPGCISQIAADVGGDAWFMHDYLHGKDGLVIHTGNSYPGNTDPFPVPIEILSWSASGSTITFTSTANSTIANGTTLQLWGFEAPGVFLNHHTITVAGLSCAATCTFTGTVSGGSGSASAATATITAWSIAGCTSYPSGTQECLATFTVSPPLATPFAYRQPVFMSGFGTSTFFNNYVLTVQPGATTSQFKAYIGHINGSATETGSAQALGAAGVPCQGAGVKQSPQWVCFPTDMEGVARALELDGSNSSIEDSYISENNLTTLAGGYDTQGIWMFVQHGPAKIWNNLIEGSSENVFTGGSGNIASQSPVRPQDVQIYYNDLYKPPYWWSFGLFNAAPSTPYGCNGTRPDGRISCYGNVKDGHELKNGLRFDSEGNIIDGNWPGWFNTYNAVEWTPRYALGQGFPSGSIDDVTFKNNIIINVEGAVTTASNDSNCKYKQSGFSTCNFGGMNALETYRVVVSNNLFLHNQIAVYGVHPYAVLLDNYLQHFWFDHNTWFMLNGLSVSDAQIVFNSTYYSGVNALQPSNNLWFTNNVTYNCNTSNATLEPQSAYATPTTNSTINLGARWRGNVCNPSSYYDTGMNPLGDNSFTIVPTFTSQLSSTCQQNLTLGSTAGCFCSGPSACGGAQPGQLNGNYTLNGPSGLTGWIAGGGKTTDNLTSGVDMGALIAATANTISGVQGIPSLVVTPQTIGNGAIGENDSIQMFASGGTQPYTAWTCVATCGLPPGYALNTSTGLITGTGSSITTAGTYPFAITVTDSTPTTSPAQPFSITINSRLRVTTTSVPTGTVGTPYNYTMQAAGGLLPYTWSSGSLPYDGISLSSSGVLSGTPTFVPAAGYIQVSAQVKDAGITNCSGANAPACGSFQIPIASPMTYVSPTSIPTLAQNVAMTPISVVVAGYSPPATYTLASGAWPTGVTLNSASGVISGTPSVGGNFTVNIQVTDSSVVPQVVTSGPLPFSVGTSLVITSTSCPNGTYNSSYSCALTATGGVPPWVSWTVVSGSLPPPLTITGSGTSFFISGIPNQAGVFPFTLRLRDSVGDTANVPLSITIQPPAPTLTISGKAKMTQGVIK